MFSWTTHRSVKCTGRQVLGLVSSGSAPPR
jgi:hypothetical protein